MIIIIVYYFFYLIYIKSNIYNHFFSFHALDLNIYVLICQLWFTKTLNIGFGKCKFIVMKKNYTVFIY